MRDRDKHNWENVNKALYPGVGTYDIPQIFPCDYTSVDEWIGFNYVKTNRGREEGKGMHFFVDDYNFLRLWRNPDKYIPMLYKYKYVLSPDFSMYTDFPLALQIYNHYRSNWLGRYMQEHYINVIPTISWSDERSYDWCFDGFPTHSTVAVSSQSCLRTEKVKNLFIQGYKEMTDRLDPTCVIFYGSIPEEIDDLLPSRVVRVDTYSKKFENYHCNT